MSVFTFCLDVNVKMILTRVYMTFCRESNLKMVGWIVCCWLTEKTDVDKDGLTSQTLT